MDCQKMYIESTKNSGFQTFFEILGYSFEILGISKNVAIVFHSSPVKLLHIFGTPFHKNIYGGLLLNVAL